MFEKPFLDINDGGGGNDDRGAM